MSFDSLAEQFANENMKAGLTNSAIVAHNTDSDKYAANRKKMRESGIHPAFATPAENKPNMEDMAALIKDFRDLKGKTAKHMSNPEFAKVAKDDGGALSRIERIYTEYGKKPLARTINRAGMFVDMMAFPFAEIADAVKGGDKFKDILVDRINKFEEQNRQAMPASDTSLAGHVIQSLVELLPLIATGPAAPALIAGEATTEKGLELGEKGVGKKIAMGLSALSGLTAYLMTKIPLTAKTYKGAIAKGVVGFPALGMAERGIEKGVLSATAETKKDKELAAQVDVFDKKSLAQDIAMGILFGGYHHYQAAKYKALIDSAKESKLKARDPEMFKNYVKDVAGDSEPVQMPVAKVDEILAEKNITPEEFFSDPQAYYESKFMNDKVDVPIEDLAANAEHFKDEHINDMNFEGMPSLNEAGKMQQEATSQEKEALERSFDTLKPAIQTEEGLKTGETGQTHNDIVPNAPEEQRGFVTPQGDFLNRQEASNWLKENKPEQYESLSDQAQKELHSEDLAKVGPGAKTAGATGETPTDIEQLASALPEEKLKSNIIKDAIADSLKTITDVKDSAVKSFKTLIEAGQKIWQSYRKPPEWTEFKEMLGQYELDKTASGLKANDFAKKINATIPRDIQEQITMWIDSGGKTDLPEEYKTLAENVRNYFASRADQAIEAGVIDHAVENYVHRIWDKTSEVGKRITAETNAGMFQQNPKLAKHRVLKSIEEGESLGLQMKDKRIGYLLTAYDSSLNEAIAARAFIKSLLKGTAKDGRALVDISGSGKQIPREGVPDSIIVKPRTKPAESVDYKPIDHPALRKWKWAGQDAEGKPILMQGDLVVHPEIYKHLNNILGKSAIREFEIWGHRPGKAFLEGVQILKSTLLSLSGFHQVQEGVHAIGHQVNPFHVGEINLNEPIQADLVKHGLMIYSKNAMQDFSEGVYASGLVSKIPVIGRQMQAYGEYLFQVYIPRLKMEMAKEAYKRNVQRYEGKLNNDQILELTANQANAAFGELNYTMMGRNKTMQDVFRLIALAPDFLEARSKFVGQALSPYGREQAAALVRIAAYMAVGAQTINYLVNGETDWSNPFAIKINNKFYQLRSIPGDMYHLVTDPRSFSYHRLNPVVTKPMVEALTGRNIFGQKQDFYQQMGDWIKGITPIPLQGLVMDKNDMTILDSILQSTGVGTRKARTSAETKLSELLRDQMPVGQTQEEKEHSFIRRKIVDAFREGKDLTDKQQEAYDAMTDRQKSNIEKEINMTPLQVSFSHLQSLDGAIKVWSKASDDEREELRDMYEAKINHYFANHDLSAEEIEKLNERLDNAENRK